MKKTITALLCVLLFMWTTPVYAAPRTVPVKIAEFPVTLNGVQVGNGYLEWLTANNRHGLKYHAQYPLLIYKDITYFPMTWYFCNLLNLKPVWSQGSGLAISQGDPDQWKDFKYDTRDAKNNLGQTASIVSFPVTVNGKLIDNSKEQYPLLLFRDVTYFPLTWRFAVNEFGWRYSYSGADGLRIDANNAVNYMQYAFDHPSNPYSSVEVFYDSYISGDLKIWIEYFAEGHAMQYGRMYISQGGKVAQVGDSNLDRFGSQDPTAEVGRFRVDGEWIYTWYSDYRQDEGNRGLTRARVNIVTKEFELLK